VPDHTLRAGLMASNMCDKPARRHESVSSSRQAGLPAIWQAIIPAGKRSGRIASNVYDRAALSAGKRASLLPCLLVSKLAGCRENSKAIWLACMITGQQDSQMACWPDGKPSCSQCGMNAGKRASVSATWTERNAATMLARCQASQQAC
jgi:hypothetical protein